MNIIRNIRNLPSFLILLSFIEMWERFSYYGMRALFVIFLVTQLGFEDPKAYAIYAIFAALSYAGPIIGGILADKLLGFRKLIVLGSLINFVGYMTITLVPISQSLFYLGLGLVVVGSGLFKGNITNLLGEFYEENDPNRHHGFSLFYVGINLGGFFGAVICGYIAHGFGWHYAFGSAGVGMLLGVIALLRFKHILGNKGLSPKPELCRKKVPFLKINIEGLVYLGAIVASLLCAFLLMNPDNSEILFIGLAALVIPYLIRQFIQSNTKERNNLTKLFIYLFFFMCFFALEMQIGAMFALFAQRNVDNLVMGIPIPATVSQSINPFTIILFGAMVSAFWSNRKVQRITLRFGSGLILMAICFFVFYVSCFFANEAGQVSFTFLFSGQVIMGIAEICLAPLMLSLTTLWAPKRLKGAIMGITMLSLSFSNMAGIYIGKLMNVPKMEAGLDPHISLGIYREGFFKIMIFNILLVGLFFAVSGLLKRRIRRKQIVPEEYQTK